MATPIPKPTRMDCECVTGFSEDRRMFFIHWCPMHKAAQDMKNALEDAPIQHIDEPYLDFIDAYKKWFRNQRVTALEKAKDSPSPAGKDKDE